MLDVQAGHCTTGQFKGLVDPSLNPIKKFTAYVNMLAVGEGTANVQRSLIAEDALGIKNANRHPVKNRLRGK